MIKEIVQGPNQAERMELELFSRLQEFQVDDSIFVHSWVKSDLII
jgi:hypothetical protein